MLYIILNFSICGLEQKNKIWSPGLIIFVTNVLYKYKTLVFILFILVLSLTHVHGKEKMIIQQRDFF